MARRENNVIKKIDEPKIPAKRAKGALRIFAAAKSVQRGNGKDLARLEKKMSRPEQLTPSDDGEISDF